MRLDGQYCVESGFWSDLGILVRTATTLGRPGCVVQLRDLAETYRHAVEVTHWFRRGAGASSPEKIGPRIAWRVGGDRMEMTHVADNGLLRG
jgi:hypothetical protein